MQLSIDTKADVLYLSLKEGKQSHTKQVAPGIILRYGLDGQVAGIEIIAASRFLGGRKLQDLELDLAPDRQVLEVEVELPKRAS